MQNQILILVTDIGRYTSTAPLLVRNGPIELTKNYFQQLNEQEKQETFNRWIIEIHTRLQSKQNNPDVLRVILNLVEDILYYHQEIDRKQSIVYCQKIDTPFARELKHSLENPIWQMF